MSDGRTDDRRVCVLGEADSIRLPHQIGRTGERADADLLVAVGESTLIELAREGCHQPILPVDAGPGTRSVPKADLEAALQAVRTDDVSESDLPVLGVAVDGETRGRALFDTMLVTSEAAHISEFDVTTPREDVAEFRADGVLVATAAGTNGYASRLGAPVFDPEVDAAAVVPVAAFATSLDHWVLTLPEDDPLLEVRVTREEAAVTLLLDDRVAGTVPPSTPITVDVVDTITVVSTPQSRSCFDRPDYSPREGGMQ